MILSGQAATRRSAIIRNCILILSIIGLIVCIAVLFPQVRYLILDFGEQIKHKKLLGYQDWFRALLSYSMGGICLIAFIDYCTLTNPGRIFVHTIKQELTACFSGMDFRSLRKPIGWMSGLYLLGVLTIIRANFVYNDDIIRTIYGGREWFGFSRYVSEYLSIFIHADTLMTDISPLPQLLAVLILAVSSVLLVYVLGNKKVTVVRLLASIPLGLSPYFLECLSYKYDAPYMALSLLASIFPFLFIDYKKAFVFCSVISLLIMCMTYQAASGVYLLIVVMLCFQAWNDRQKTTKEILSMAKAAIVAFGLTMIIFKLFLMRAFEGYVSGSVFPLPELISGVAMNIKQYLYWINSDFGLIWKVCIGIVLLFFVIKSVYASTQKKMISLAVSLVVIGLSLVLSYGVYCLLQGPLYLPRALFGFGAWLAILCIYVVSNYKKIAIIAVFALNWSFLVFAFSYGNASADQARYTNFRIGVLLHDLSALYPDGVRGDKMLQFKNSIDYTPSVKNIARHYPVIERLIPKREGEVFWFDYYCVEYFNYAPQDILNIFSRVDYSTYNLPVALDSYYHTIQSDGEHILVTLKH
ncbi:MAG: glucosyltransferase domain-containing protein [Dysgonamonadaceae bacterium]|jgi:hypothetical protein|nr:glucosyltransferase domain-containing protein [Dysgonamonadaceae bacterium]